jgi:hypothetical protein
MNVNALSMHLNGISGFSPGGSGYLDYVCTFRDVSFSQKMFCEWSASIIAFDPVEMVSAASPPLQQLTFLNQSSIAERVHNGYQVPGGGLTQGLFDALGGVSLYYKGTQDHPIWIVEASASGFQIGVVPSNSGAAEYGLFLGTTFGDRVNTTAYDYQMSRAVGFLR